MLNHRFIRTFAFIGAAVLLTALFAITAFAQDAEEMEYPTILAAEDGTITLPEEWVSGIATITLQNDTEIAFEPAIARFIDGATMEDFMAAMMAQDFAGMLATVSALGAPSVEPGESVDITYDLQAGDYIFLNFLPAAPPTILPFTVAENDGEPMEAPEEDLEVAMADFVFNMPTELTTEDVLWKFTNVGEQTHEIVVFSVEEDATVEAITEAFMTAMMNTTPGTPTEWPYEQAFRFVGQSSNETAWMNVELEPGNYVAICIIPDTEGSDFATGEIITHLEHGMITLFTVSEKE